MPKLNVEGVGEFEVEEGTRLVLALTDTAQVDQLHACGGQGRCTTCRVEITDGAPSQMTAAEKETLTAREMSGVGVGCVTDHAPFWHVRLWAYPLRCRVTSCPGGSGSAVWV